MGVRVCVCECVCELLAYRSFAMQEMITFSLEEKERKEHNDCDC